ncbi:MAG: OmpA family protein [Acidobacteriota bacterium]
MPAPPANFSSSLPIALALTLITTSAASSPRVEPLPETAPTDYLTFAEGAVLVSSSTFDARKSVGSAEAMQLIDGSPGGFTLVAQAGADGGAELVYSLPAATTFESFAVPQVLETPSPSQTFVQRVTIHGSAAGPEGPWTVLADLTLTRHAARGHRTVVPATTETAVRWVKVRLSGGLDMARELMFLECSEIVGHGRQEAPPLSSAFDGTWKGRGVLIELHQDGAMVHGCVDREGAPFTGTVTGNVLRGRSIAPASQVQSLYVLTVADDQLLGVRSANGAPFRAYEGAPTKVTTPCSEPSPPVIGCDSVLHGINFDFDSATIRPDSEPLLKTLFAGLKATPDQSFVIEGHTSSEGSTEYNQGLSERRAQAVVADLVRRGLPTARIRAVGRGELTPIADNATASGRSLNRRVEVHCENGP